MQFTIAVIGLLWAFLMFDHVVRIEYNERRAAWEADGRPRGFLWHAPECTWSSGWATNRLAFSWLFKTPVWAMELPACRQSLWRLRACVAVWNAAILLSLLLALWALP